MNKNKDEELIKKIRNIALLLCDVDGVLTDGRIIMDNRGNESKHFNVRDGHGLKMLIRYGIGVALLTGRESAVVAHRARDIGITEVYQGIKNKGAFVEEYIQKNKVKGERIAYVGDDIVDVPVFRLVGFSAAVADASEHVKAAADYVTHLKGGMGAVRELCELILMAQNKWDAVVTRYQIN